MSVEPHLHPGHRPPSLPPTAGSALRRRARAVAATAGCRLRLAAHRVGGDAGMALDCALVDMINDDVYPVGWPVPEAIALLRDEAGRDRQVERLLADLREIENLIAALPTGPVYEEIIRRPAA